MKDGAPWFLALDVCAALDLNGSTARHLKKLDPDQVSKVNRIEVGEKRAGRPMSFISESGLYILIMRSDKPQAKPFQDWVTRDVLPSIRKTGGYVLGEEKLTLESEEDLERLHDHIVKMAEAKLERYRECRAKEASLDLEAGAQYSTLTATKQTDDGSWTVSG